MSAQTTWMSGGSGSGVYDPVTTTDNVNVQFSDQDENWQGLKGRGRTYNFGTYRKSGVKAVCDEIRNRTRPKCLLVTFIATVVLIVLLLIIVIASSRNSQSVMGPDYEKRVNKSTGLNFVPPGHLGTVYLPFSLRTGQEDSYRGYTDSLDTAVEAYKTTYIFNHTHVVCNKTYNPPDAVCQQPLSVFGTSCTHTHRYGYPVGQPCILLYFSLPKSYTVRALLPKDGDVYVQAEKILGDRYSPDNVGISCEPATPEDKKNVGTKSELGDAIEYNPSQGFPSYFFRPRNADLFIPPAVMVQFRTIRQSLGDPQTVRLTCTAWGKAFDPHGQPVNENMFHTSFVFRIH